MYSEFVAVAKTLWTLSVVHCYAGLAAARSGCHALGMLNARILTSEKALARRVSEVAGLELAKTSQLLKLLTYGSGGQENADPALQPLIPLGSHVGIAPNLLTHGAMERNFMVLLNRMPDHRSAYSELSRQRESILKDEIVNRLEPLGLRTWSGNLAAWGTEANVDLVVSDHESKCSLMLELKSFLAPAEPRELRDRSEEIAKGIEQIKRRKLRFAADPRPLIGAIGGKDSFRIEFAVASATSIGSSHVQSPEGFHHCRLDPEVARN